MSGFWVVLSRLSTVIPCLYRHWFFVSEESISNQNFPPQFSITNEDSGDLIYSPTDPRYFSIECKAPDVDALINNIVSLEISLLQDYTLERKEVATFGPRYERVLLLHCSLPMKCGEHWLIPSLGFTFHPPREVMSLRISESSHFLGWVWSKRRKTIRHAL